MYKIRLILKGVIFLTMATGQQGQKELWLLLLDPGYATAIHHHAHLYVDMSAIDLSKTKRPIDGKDHDGEYFDLAGDHMTFSSTGAITPNVVEFIKNTKPAGLAKPQAGADFKNQRNDIHWVNSLADILKNVPLKSGRTFAEATTLRGDILRETYFKDGLILARIAIPAGRVRTFTLWGEGEDESNVDPAGVFTYVFKEPWIECLAQDKRTAVADIVVVEFETKGSIMLSSRSLADGGRDEDRDIITKSLSADLTVVISSMRHHGATRRDDFSAFYQLLEHPEYFHYLPLPKVCQGGDSGGACSPAVKDRP